MPQDPPGPKGGPARRPKGEPGPQGPKVTPAIPAMGLLEGVLNAATASRRTFPTELQALKVLFQAGNSQSKGTLHWVCSTSDGTQLLSASAPCAASSSMSSPPTRTFSSFQALPCFGQYLCFAASGTTGAPPAVVLPAGSGGQNVDASQKLGRLTLTVDTNVRHRRCHDRAVGRSGLSGNTETVPDRTFGKFLSLSMKFLCFVLMHLHIFVILVKKRKVGSRPWMSLFGLSIRSSTIPC